MTDLLPEPAVDSTCLCCNERQPVEGHGFCAECLQEYAVLMEQNQDVLTQNAQILQNQLALGSDFVLRVTASTKRIQECTARIEEWNARVEHNQARRAGQRDMLAAWQAQRDTAPLPKPLSTAPLEQWFAYIDDQRQRGQRETWEAIAGQANRAKSTLISGYSKWKRQKTTKNNLLDEGTSSSAKTHNKKQPSPQEVTTKNNIPDDTDL